MVFILVPFLLFSSLLGFGLLDLDRIKETAFKRKTSLPELLDFDPQTS